MVRLSFFHRKKYGMQWNYATIFLVLIHLRFGRSTETIDRKDAPLPPPTFCTSDDCLRSAAHLKLSMNPNIEPCDNFYLYTCGKWIEQHPNCRDWTDFDGFDIIDQKVADAEQAVLTASRSRNEPKALRKMRNFYKSCMDEDSKEKLEKFELYDQVINLNLPMIPDFLYSVDEEFSESTYDWSKTEAHLKRNLALDVFFASKVEINLFNSSEYVIMMGTPDDETPLPGLQKEPEDVDEDKLRRVKERIIKYTLRNVHPNPVEEFIPNKPLHEAVHVILAMETRLLELIGNYSDPNAESEDLRPHTLESLQNRTNELLSTPLPNFWLTYFGHLFEGTNVTFNPEKDVVYVTDQEIEYLCRVVQFLEDTPTDNLVMFYWWKAYYALLVNGNPSAKVYIVEEMNKLRGSEEQEDPTPSKGECVSLVSKHMGYALTHALLDQFSSKDTKTKIETMLNNMRLSFISNVKQITWMDDATKKATIEKAKEILMYIGYPDWLSNKEKLDEYYSDVVIKPYTYLANLVSSIRSHNMRKLRSFRKKPVREWAARGFDQNEAIMANAFYMAQHNAIEVPMVVLRYPMYRLGLELLNYGAIGGILGHELTHAFDNDGRKFDKFGNERTWWSNETIENFQNLTECFVTHYENITLDGVSGQINGTLTLAENIADNGGLRAAFNAYQRYEKKYGVEPKLPGFENYTTEQVFFIAYTSAWCMELKPSVDLDEERDEHAPHYLRVLGTLQNSKQFSSAFQCPVGSFMNPKKKCNIW